MVASEAFLSAQATRGDTVLVLITRCNGVARMCGGLRPLVAICRRAPFSTDPAPFGGESVSRFQPPRECSSCLYGGRSGDFRCARDASGHGPEPDRSCMRRLIS